MDPTSLPGRRPNPVSQIVFLATRPSTHQRGVPYNGQRANEETPHDAEILDAAGLKIVSVHESLHEGSYTYRQAHRKRPPPLQFSRASGLDQATAEVSASRRCLDVTSPLWHFKVLISQYHRPRSQSGNDKREGAVILKDPDPDPESSSSVHARSESQTQPSSPPPEIYDLRQVSLLSSLIAPRLDQKRIFGPLALDPHSRHD